MTETISAAEARKLLSASKGAGKGRVRGTKRLVVQGLSFDSVRESQRWLLLRDREKRGEITQLTRQDVFLLEGRDGPILTPTGRQMIYKSDFQYFDNISLRWVVEDAKGFMTEKAAMKLAIMAAQGVKVELV